MAFRYIEHERYIAAVAYETRKPRLLLAEPQRLFRDGLTRLLAPSFHIIDTADPLDSAPPDLIVVDADSTPIGSLADISGSLVSEPALCLLSLNAEPRMYAGGARFHVLSKKSSDRDFLAALIALAAQPKQPRIVLAPRIETMRNLNFSAVYLVAAHGANAGGDWYDVFDIPRGRVMFVIGDVAGHGIEAALTMAPLRQSMIAFALKNTDPASILTRTNALIVKQGGLLTTVLCGFIDTRTREIVYASAGHPPALLVDGEGSAQFLGYDGLMLGVESNASYRTFRVNAPDAGLLVLYTDGVTEAGRDAALGELRLLHAACDAAVSGAEDAAGAIHQAVFKDIAPEDDAAILTIGFGSPVLQTAACA
ncbi:MAG: SpoIIE family protein phosphatase [Candidatus Baltobacteraceae bacterium]